MSRAAERVAFQLPLCLAGAGIIAVAEATDVIPVAVHPIVGGGDDGLACALPVRAAGS